MAAGKFLRVFQQQRGTRTPVSQPRPGFGLPHAHDLNPGGAQRHVHVQPRSGRNAAQHGRFQIIGGNAAQENAYYKTDYNNFAPTVGVAYTPNFESGIGRFLFGSEGKSVLRGGYSQAYVNDSILTALSGADGSNVGLGSTPAQAVGNGSANLNLRLSGARPTIAPPVFNGPPN